MKRGILETVSVVICFSALIAYFNNWYALIPMIVLVILFLGL